MLEREMRAARALGLQTYALWRLGSEDDSLWKVWDSPGRANPEKDLAEVDPGYDVDTEGEGDILRVTRKPQPGRRYGGDGRRRFGAVGSEDDHGREDGLVSPVVYGGAIWLSPEEGSADH